MDQPSPFLRWTLIVSLLLPLSLCHGIAVSVDNGYDLHAAMSSSQVHRIIIELAEVHFTIFTCPLPHMPVFPTTVLGRTLYIGADPDGPYRILDCGLLSNRFLLSRGSVLTLNHIMLRNCSGSKELNFFRKDEGATLILDDVIQDRGSFCAPPKLIGEQDRQQERPSDIPGSGPATEQRLRVAEAGTNWCIPANTEPGVPRLDPPSHPLCGLQALLLQDVVIQKEQGPEDLGSWNLVYRNVVQVSLALQAPCRQ